MAVKKAELKPSLQRILDAREALKARIAEARVEEVRIAEARVESESDGSLVKQLRDEIDQLKTLFVHMSAQKRITVTSEYVFNMTDGNLEVLREFLQAECDGLLHTGKNHTSRIYVNCSNELKAVLAEQARRAEVKSLETVAADVA